MSVLKDKIKNILFKIPKLGKRLKVYDEFRKNPFIPGHYYSVIPDHNELIENKERIFNNETIRDIDFNEQEQYELLEKLKIYYNDFPYFKNIDDINYRYNNKSNFYKHSDAIFLFCMLRYLQPNKVIEVGSGHSSALMLDTNELFLNKNTGFVFIEPYPEERLLSVIKTQDESYTKIIKKKVQQIDVTLFKELKENDILFIDSSHVSKTGSDVNFLFFDVFPELNPGVYIHIHDIFFPFELPVEWVIKERWYWNENYLLRAFLMNNDNYKIVLFNNLLHRRNRDWFSREMPACLIETDKTGSMWIKKIR